MGYGKDYLEFWRLYRNHQIRNILNFKQESLFQALGHQTPVGHCISQDVKMGAGLALQFRFEIIHITIFLILLAKRHLRIRTLDNRSNQNAPMTMHIA